MVGPLVEDPGAPAGVVADRVGEAEAADQVEGGLDELADPGPRLVGAEQLDGEPVHLAADPLLQRADRGQQGGVGAGRDPQLEGGGEDRAGEVVGEHLQHRPGASRPGRQRWRPRRPARRRAPRSGARPRPRPGRSWSGSGAAGRPGSRPRAARPAWSTYRRSRARPGTRPSPRAAAPASARVRSSCGTRTSRLAGHLASIPPHQQTVKPDFFCVDLRFGKVESGQVHREADSGDAMSNRRQPAAGPPGPPGPHERDDDSARPASIPHREGRRHDAATADHVVLAEQPPVRVREQPPPYEQPAATAVRSAATPRRTDSRNSPTRRPVSTARPQYAAQPATGYGQRARRSATGSSVWAPTAIDQLAMARCRLRAVDRLRHGRRQRRTTTAADGTVTGRRAERRLGAADAARRRSRHLASSSGTPAPPGPHRLHRTARAARHQADRRVRPASPPARVMSFVRWLLHIIDHAVYIGYLWPLWDDKRQTFTDKILETVVIKQPRADRRARGRTRLRPRRPCRSRRRRRFLRSRASSAL